MDIPSGKHQRISKITVQKIREEVLKGKSKYQIARDMGLRFGVVYYHTQDLPNHVYREEGLAGKTLDLLKEMLKNGYVLSTEENTQRLRRLKRYLPMIQRAQMDGRAVYYLSDKNKIALQAMVQRKRSKIISFQELSAISKIFDVKLLDDDKFRFFGKNKPRSRRRNHKSKPVKVSVSKEKKTPVDDFFGRFLHSEGLKHTMV